MNSFFYLDDLPEELNMDVPAGKRVDFRFVSFDSGGKHSIKVTLGENSVFVAALADFSPHSSSLNAEIVLAGPYAKTEWHLASMGSSSNEKSYFVNVLHKAPKTEGLESDYGIAKDSSKLIFTGSSKIFHGSSETKTRQEARIIVFDEKADGIASPILEIDENDVLASHAATVGRINEQHLFYLRSRGLSLPRAKRLIALGYLKPIEAYFADDSLKERIDAGIPRPLPDLRSQRNKKRLPHVFERYFDAGETACVAG